MNSINKIKYKFSCFAITAASATACLSVSVYTLNFCIFFFLFDIFYGSLKLWQPKKFEQQQQTPFPFSIHRCMNWALLSSFGERSFSMQNVCMYIHSTIDELTKQKSVKKIAFNKQYTTNLWKLSSTGLQNYCHSCSICLSCTDFTDLMMWKKIILLNIYMTRVSSLCYLVC